MNRRFSILTLLVLSLGIYVATAAQPALLDDADASHALVSREMLQRGDWVVMYQDGIRYLEKAPLHYWMVAISYKLFSGQGAFQTRLPLVLSVAGLVHDGLFFCPPLFRRDGGVLLRADHMPRRGSVAVYPRDESRRPSLRCS